MPLAKSYITLGTLTETEVMMMTVDMQVEIDEARYSLDTVMDANLYKYEELFDYSGT